jgi:hypothetical protein
MIRTQISLKPKEVSWLKREAKARGTSMAGIVRNIIHEASARERMPSQKRLAQNGKTAAVKQRHPWVGICKDGPSTDASLADEYLYGRDETA